MKYEGRLYGKVGGKHIQLEMTSDQVDALIEENKRLRQICRGQMADYFGIGENTLRSVEQRQPEVLEAYKRGRGKAIAGVAGNLISQARNGNTTAAIFYLKTQAGWRETDAPQNQQPIPLNLVNPDA